MKAFVMIIARFPQSRRISVTASIFHMSHSRKVLQDPVLRFVLILANVHQNDTLVSHDSISHKYFIYIHNDVVQTDMIVII